MMQALTLNEYKTLAQKAKRVAVFREISVGNSTPIHSYRLLSEKYGEKGVILENLNKQDSIRYSYICFNPLATLKIVHGEQHDPLDMLRNFQSQYSFLTRNDVANKINGAVGFMTYDIVRYFENIPDRHPVDPLLPIILFHFYTLNLTFNHREQSILISTVVDVSDNYEIDYQKACHKIEETVQLIASNLPEMNHLPEFDKSTTIDVDISDSDFINKIKKAKEYIIAGDAFQIVLSRCFKRHYSAEPLEIYKTLCQVSPSPFMFYFPTEAGVMLGASPERMVSVIDREVAVNPIAGTRKRLHGGTDESIIADLLGDKKELAEHMMLVDLARNDVGSVSEPGSVIVSELLQVKHYSHVSHIVSTVKGQLKNKYDSFNAFSAAFPMGTLSGAPKIRAMEIIDELETSRRGIYGGAICRIDAIGNFDSCIAIRMAFLREQVATIRVGAGIVYDSDPASEAEETRQKAKAMLHAIAEAHGEHYDINHR